MTTSHSPFYLIKQLISVEREDIVTLISYGIFIGIMSLAMPVAVQVLVNTVAFGGMFQPLVVLSIIFSVLLAFSNTLAGLQFYMMDMLQRRLFVRVLSETATRLQKARIESSDHHHLPELVNRFLDVVNLNKAATTILLETLGYVLQTVIGMLLLAFYHPLLLAFDVFLIIGLGFTLFGLSKNGIETAIAQSKAKYEVLAWLQNIAANLVISKSAAAHSFLDNKTEQVAQNYLNKCAKHFVVLSRQNTSGLVLHTLANSLLLSVGGFLVWERQLSLGQLIAAELIVSNMMYGLSRLGKTLSSFYALVVSGDKLGHLLDIPQESEQGMMVKPTDLPYQVDVYGIVLPESPNLDVIQGLDLHLRAGDSLVISGSVERGSLLDVLYGLRLPTSGYVRLNDHDLRDLNLRFLRDTVCLVRDAEIIDATVLDNLRLSRDIELSVLWDVLDKIGLHDAVASLSDGLNHQLSQNGAPLTTEQCLRLTLARAIVAKPRLLLLDATLDRIDQRVLPDLLDYLFADNAPWTLIITSHHPLVVARARCHVQLRNGILVEA